MLVKFSEYKEEIRRIERNSHQFLKYFGILWGSVLVFVLGNYEDNAIAVTIREQLVEFFLSPLDGIGALGVLLLFLGVMYVLVSFILLSANASSISPYNPSRKNRMKYLETGKEFLSKSVLMGIFGTVIIFFLFILSLMNANEVGSIQLLRQIFFWGLFILIFFVDPIYLLLKKESYRLLIWINLIISVAIGLLFTLSQAGVNLSSVMSSVFLWMFLIYFPIRLVFSLWWQPFYFTNWILSVIPKIPEQKL